MYSPSPGTVYPRLAALEQEGLIEVVGEEEGRKVYRRHRRRREELAARKTELAGAWGTGLHARHARSRVTSATTSRRRCVICVARSSRPQGI